MTKEHTLSTWSYSVRKVLSKNYVLELTGIHFNDTKQVQGFLSLPQASP